MTRPGDGGVAVTRSGDGRVATRRPGDGRVATRRPGDGGVILVNVLVVLGLAGVLVALMLDTGDRAIARSQRFSEGGRALALIEAGERSAIVALRRDMVLAPDVDHPGEPWGRVAQKPVAIEGGGFALTISDAQDRFNLNAVAPGAQETQEARKALAAIVAAAGLPEGTADAIARSIAGAGPLQAPGDLAGRGVLAPAAVLRLARFVTALPGAAPVNVNSAAPELLALLLASPALADKVVGLRRAFGFLTPETLSDAGIDLPGTAGLASSLYRVRTTVRVGDTVQSMESLLQRRRGPGGAPEVVAVARRNALASPPEAPEEPES